MNATPTKSSSTEKPTIEAPPPLGLVTLAERCGELHRAGTKNRQELRALLTKAKQDAGPGGWTRWLADNREVLGFGERQAQVYLLSEAHHGAALAAKAASAREERRIAKTSKAPEAAEPEFEAVKAQADAAGYDLVRLDPPQGMCRYRIIQRSERKQRRSWDTWLHRTLNEVIRLHLKERKPLMMSVDEEFARQANKDQQEARADIAKWKAGRNRDGSSIYPDAVDEAEREAADPSRERKLTLARDLVTAGYKAMLEKFKDDEYNSTHESSPSELEEIRDRLLQMVEQEWEV